MTEHPALVAAARWGIAPRPPRAVAIEPDAVPTVLGVASIDRMAGFLYAAIAAGVVETTAEFAARIRELWHQQLEASVVVEAHAVRVATVLDSAGVTWRLTKGAALAHLDYPDPALRTFGDVDVIVHPSSWTDALAVLAAAGYERELAELASGFDERFGKGATLVAADGLELDLHRRLAIGRFGVRLPTEVLFDDVELVALAGRLLPVLDGSSRLLHACFHAALGGFRHFRAHRDVAQLLLVSEVDWERTVRIAERSRVSAVIARAIRDAWATLELEDTHPAHDWAARQRIGWLDAHALGVFAAERPFDRQALTALPALFGRGSMAYIYALARQGGRSPKVAR